MDLRVNRKASHSALPFLSAALVLTACQGRVAIGDGTDSGTSNGQGSPDSGEVARAGDGVSFGADGGFAYHDGGVVAPADAGGTCSSNVQCGYALGVPARCVDDACVALVTSDGLCTTTGPIGDDDAVLLGVLVPQEGPGGETARGLGFSLAPNFVTNTAYGALLENWNAFVDVDGGGVQSAPSFAAVVCDESRLDASLSLFAKLNVQEIVGTVSSAALATVTEKFPDTPVFAPLADDPKLAAQTSTHVWSCSPNRQNLVADFTSAIDLVSHFILAQPGRGPTIKIALVTNSTEPSEAHFTGSGTTSATLLPLTWNNGESSSDSTVFEEFDLASEGDGADEMDQDGSEPVLMAREIVAFQPDLVVITGSVLATNVIAQVEPRSSASAGRNLPTYLVFRETEELAIFAAAAVPALTGSGAGDAGTTFNRLFALDITRDALVQQNFTSLQGDLRAVEEGAPFLDTNVESSFTDCIYLAMYATTAAQVSSGTPATALTPADIAAGVARLTTSSSSPVGNAISLGSATNLAAGIARATTPVATSELIGTSMYYGLNAKTGAPTLAAPNQAVGIYCINTTNAWFQQE